MNTTHERRRVRPALGLIISLSPLLFLLLVLSPAVPAQADSVVTNCTEAGLDAALVGGGLITFNCGGVHAPATILLSSAASIITDTTADGANGGHTITLDGQGTTSLFYVSPAVTLTLAHLSVVNGYNAADGGAITNAAGGTLIIDHGTFSNNHTDPNHSGGAILSYGVLKIGNSTFDHNYAGNGGALFPRDDTSATIITSTTFLHNYTTNTSAGWGGAMLVWVGAPVTVDGSQFISNTAQQGGAANVVAYGSLTLTNSLAQDNLATEGGALASLGTLALVNTDVRANHAITGGGLALGGAASINASQIEGNAATLFGGGLRVNQAGYVFVNNSQVSRNSQDTTNFSNPFAPGGGGLTNEGYVQLNGSLLSDNSTGNSGGGAANIGKGVVSLINSVVSGNSAFVDGGGVYNAAQDLVLHSTTLDVFYTTFKGNSAFVGGGIFTDFGATTSVLHATLSGNSANEGGAMANTRSALVNVGYSTLSGNSAANDGGAVDNLGLARLNLLNATLSANQAGNLGGGLFLEGGSASMLNVTLSDNRAASGGALHIQPAASAMMTNTVLAYSPQGGNCYGTLAAARFSLSSDLTCGLTETVKGLNPNGLDPLLSALGNYGGPTRTHMLKLGSPAIDGVGGSAAPMTDQRGLPRPAGSGYDLGAVERQDNDSSLAPWLWLPLARR